MNSCRHGPCCLPCVCRPAPTTSSPVVDRDTGLVCLDARHPPNLLGDRLHELTPPRAGLTYTDRVLVPENLNLSATPESYNHGYR